MGSIFSCCLPPLPPCLSVALDIHMMLYGGFGFLMTFLKRYGFSAVSMTMMLTAMVTEWAIILQGFTRMNDDFTIPLSFME